MSWSRWTAVVLGLCGATDASLSRAEGAGPQPAAVAPEEVAWKPDARGPGLQSAVVSGDPKQPGPYVLRVKMSQDARLPPHRHPDVRYVTVLTGVFHLGFGETFDAARLKAYPAGSLIVIPANVPHFAWVERGESIQQDMGWGPTGSTPVAPAATVPR
jgi:quercetin dioxygenase-like cupin family protein